VKALSSNPSTAEEKKFLAKTVRKEKDVWGCGSVADYLPNKDEALSSTPSGTPVPQYLKKKKK
jgi:hypothetical protein